jgi:cysteinyl-tRNA synthetase
MSIRHLGETFDIHGGGMDLIFPHHENEIAQSSAATGKEFALYWVHNGFVEINKEKMSKSLGNFFTIREVFERSGCRESVTAEALRYFLLATHYRSPLDFSDLGLRESKRALDGLYDLFLRLEEGASIEGIGDRSLQAIVDRLERGFRESMDDDCNTPAAIAQFQQARSEVNALLNLGLSRQGRDRVRDVFRRLGQVLGVFRLAVADWEFKDLQFHVGETAREPAGGSEKLADVDIERLLTARHEARRAKDFARADEIRAQLAAQGIAIEDRPDGTSRWKR